MVRGGNMRRVGRAFALVGVTLGVFLVPTASEVAPAAADTPTIVNVTGTLRTASGAAVVGARVTFANANGNGSAVTDSAGGYSFQAVSGLGTLGINGYGPPTFFPSPSGPPPTTSTAPIPQSFFLEATGSIDVDRTIDLTLPPTVTPTAEVVDGQGLPVANASVSGPGGFLGSPATFTGADAATDGFSSFTGSFTPAPRTFSTDSTGRGHWTGFIGNQGGWTASGSRDGVGRSTTVSVVATSDVVVPFVLDFPYVPPRVTVSGTVRTASGAPVATAQVLISSSLGSGSATTDSNGTYVTSMVPGAVTVTVASAPSAFPLGIGPSPTSSVDPLPARFSSWAATSITGSTTLDLQLPPTTTLTARTVDMDGAPVPNVTIPLSGGPFGSMPGVISTSTSLAPGGTPTTGSFAPSTASASTDASGTATFLGFAGTYGTVTVTATRDGQTATTSAAADATSDTTVTFVLPFTSAPPPPPPPPALVTISGTLRTSTGAPVAYAAVQATSSP